MWMFTNRTVATGSREAAWSARFTPFDRALGMAQVVRTGSGWRLQDSVRAVEDTQAGLVLRSLFAAQRPLLVYLHGYNNPPASLFDRCERLERLHDVEVIGFSWPSEGRLFDGTAPPAAPPAASPPASLGEAEAELGRVSEWAVLTQQPGIGGLLQRYRQAKVNATQSVQAFERFVHLLALARLSAARQPFTLAAHSLGAYLLQQSLGEPGAATALGAAQNLVLLAPCCASAGHPVWLQRLHPAGQVVITVNAGDQVLMGARVADRNEAKLGSDPGPKLLEGWVRYAHLDGSGSDLAGHSDFAQADLPPDLKRLFGRLFSSQRDLGPGEPASAIYLGGCDADGVTCWTTVRPRPGDIGGPS